jgi:hypothetical protein
VFFASFALLPTLLALELQRSPRRYRALLHVAAAWTCLHAVLLVIQSLGNDFAGAIASFPSLYVWVPGYNLLLIGEAALLMSFSLLVFVSSRSLRPCLIPMPSLQL